MSTTAERPRSANRTRASTGTTHTVRVATTRTTAARPVGARPRRSRLLPYAALLAALGVVAVVASALYLRSVSGDESLAYAKTRDTVTVQGRQDIVVMNSLDAATTDKSISAWLSVSTGVLHDQLAQIPDVQKKALKDSGATTSAKVVDAVLTELDDRAGTARMIASVELTVVGKDGKPSVKRNRFSADLTLDGQQWKLSQLQQVAVNAS